MSMRGLRKYGAKLCKKSAYTIAYKRRPFIPTNTSINLLFHKQNIIGLSC